jgi:uncharacterized protein YjbI with pentapeptide repeats
VGADHELPAQLRGASLAGLDLTGRDLSGEDLSGADLSGATLSGADLSGANLSDATLASAVLRDANCTGTIFVRADLSDVDAAEAGLGDADLRDATLFGARFREAVLSQAKLQGADLRAVDFTRARLRECQLTGTDLTKATLVGADLTQSDVTDACFDDADLRGARVKRVVGFEEASWYGADILDVDFTGAYVMRRFIMDQNYLAEIRARSKGHAALAWVWWATSDYGRSAGRWAAWTLLIALGFAAAYGLVDVDYGDHETQLSPLYYSVVTLTTLGYGDVLPASPAAQIVAMVEVVLGYVMLGGLLSIFSTKMARRAD